MVACPIVLGTPTMAAIICRPPSCSFCSENRECSDSRTNLSSFTLSAPPWFNCRSRPLTGFFCYAPSRLPPATAIHIVGLKVWFLLSFFCDCTRAVSRNTVQGGECCTAKYLRHGSTRVQYRYELQTMHSAPVLFTCSLSSFALSLSLYLSLSQPFEPWESHSQKRSGTQKAGKMRT